MKIKNAFKTYAKTYAKNYAKTSAKFLLHILVPDTCLHCGVDLKFNYPYPLCKDCESKLEPLPELHCKRCGVVLFSGGAHCYRCRGHKAENYKCSVIRSALVYNPQIRSVIHHFKYGQKSKLANYLGDFLSRAFKEYPQLADCNCIIPVALMPKKMKMRGFNQAGLLGRHLSKSLNINFYDDALKRVQYNKSQTDLTREQRIENVRDAFMVARPEVIKGKNVLLIDDVCTTASTLEECARVLKASKASSVKALTVARE